ncbi:GerAB/ArcD/ProY family transporter [Paenibacillus sp. FSL P4-0338]|uniref:GerAB/ArcD/ProY family transporter n=2 Tax=unclassified Paenibacillus TaxID=185978 RepID=UPI0030FAD164
MMAKSRYFYCLFLMNSLINIINFTPRELIDARFEGAQSSIVIAVVTGTLFIYLFTKVINKFPGQGLPEIFGAALPKLLASPLIFIYALLWYTAGALIMLSFVDITLRFISPDTWPYAVLLGFLAVVCLCSRMDSLSLLYGLEVTLGITLPLILYATVKAVVNPDFSWDAVLQIMTFPACAGYEQPRSGNLYIQRVHQFSDFQPGVSWLEAEASLELESGGAAGAGLDFLCTYRVSRNGRDRAACLYLVHNGGQHPH